MLVHGLAMQMISTGTDLAGRYELAQRHRMHRCKGQSSTGKAGTRMSGGKARKLKTFRSWSVQTAPDEHDLAKLLNTIARFRAVWLLNERLNF